MCTAGFTGCMFATMLGTGRAPSVSVSRRRLRARAMPRMQCIIPLCKSEAARFLPPFFGQQREGMFYELTNWVGTKTVFLGCSSFSPRCMHSTLEPACSVSTMRVYELSLSVCLKLVFFWAGPPSLPSPDPGNESKLLHKAKVNQSMVTVSLIIFSGGNVLSLHVRKNSDARGK